MPNRPLLVDLFAGCGGLSLGLEQAGFEPVFVNELNPDALETYLRNRENTNPWLRDYFVRDIKELVRNDGEQLEAIQRGLLDKYGKRMAPREIDLVAGGPPCQGYSGIGHRRSYSVEKKQLPSNFLYQDMAFIIHRLRPKMFLFENVKGLLAARWSAAGQKGEIWEDVLETFAAIPGYVVRWALVHAKDYGVPQNRPRVLLVGIREDLGILPAPGKVADGFLPEPIGGAPDLCDLLSDLVDENYVNGGQTTHYPAPARTPIQRLLRTDPRTGKVAAKGQPVSEHQYSNHSPDIVEKFRYMLENEGRIPAHMKTKKFAQRVLPPRWGANGPSITATSLADDYVHFSQPRTLTVREWARLQMFPDWYQFAGKRTTGGVRRAGNPREGIFDREVPKYTQIGNAVPVGLAKAVGDHLLSLLSAARVSIIPEQTRPVEEAQATP